MKIDDYAAIARSTAIYNQSARFVYPSLGLCGEIGELVDKVFKGAGVGNPPEFTEEATKEIGDVLWYIVNAGMDLEIPFREIVAEVTAGLYVDTFGGASFARATVIDKRSPYLKLTVYAGWIAEIAKKTLRDCNGEVTDQRRNLVRACLWQLLVSLFQICEMNGLDIDAIAAGNIAKLQSRAARGKLQGDGDNR